MVDQSISKVWADIEAWLAVHAPDRKAELRPAASEATLGQLTETMAVPLPEGYLASLRCHNGAAYLTTYQYLDAETVLLCHEEQAALIDDERAIHNPDAKLIQPRWWHAAWLPFAQDSEGNLLCLDLDPGEKGQFGQVLRWEMSMGPAPSGEPSFDGWLASYRDGLLNGRFFVDGGFIYER